MTHRAYSGFLFTLEDGVATVQFDRPAKLNALTLEAYKQLGEMAFDLREDDTVRVVVITGTGKGFCSGGDLNDIGGKLLKANSSELMAFQRMAGRITKGLLAIRKPTIAAINGFAGGAGAVIALACDFRIAAESARIAFSFPNVGVPSSDLGACWLLPRMIGLTKAMELLLTGDAIDAHTAERIGLVNRVVPDDKLEGETRCLSRRLAAFSPLGNGMTKTAVYKELAMDFDSAIDFEGWLMSLALHTEDSKEGTRAVSG
ncbi:MAG: enoyl-CoA hydratase/isomerase family protein, partial [Chloroflexi bacterium]|nr:enoyl-CoA hydratase/isomerase family protein [Chloroflexota bacterium]